MKKLLKSLQKILPIKKEQVTTKDLFDNMHKLLDEAEADFGGNVFPKEKLLSSEQVHYRTLRLKEGSDFEKIRENYSKLKKKYNPENYKKDEAKYQKAIEANMRIELAFNYFKNKYKISN